MSHSFQVTIDCADPHRLATFWAAVLGYKIQDPPTGYATWQEFLTAQGVPESEWNSASAIVDSDGDGTRIFFQRVPEPKTMKNRLHLDVNVGGGPSVALAERRPRVDEAVERIVGLGASRVGPVDERGEYWVVMRDPEGNEFCVQ
jgi:hypothetical protein